MVWLSIVASLALYPASFQVQSSTTGGLQTVQIQAPEGKIIVYLPADIQAGDTISGTVIAQPNGSSEPERQKNLSVLEGVVISTPGGSATPAQPSFTWTMPLFGAASSFDLEAKGGSVRSSKLSIPVAGAKASPALFHLPKVVQSNRHTRILGPFDGNSQNTSVAIGDSSIPILAESPRGAVAFCPPIETGPSQLLVGDQGENAGQTVHVVDLKLTAKRLTLMRGEKSELQLAVTGLAGCRETVAIHLENRTPDILTLDGGSSFDINIQPTQVNSNGDAMVTLLATAKKEGNFSISASIPTLMAPPILLNVEIPPGFKPMPDHPDGVQADDTQLDKTTKTPPQGFNPKPEDDKQFKRDPNDDGKWQHRDAPEKKTFTDFVAWLQKHYVVSFVENGKKYRGGSYRVHFKYTGSTCVGGKWRQIVKSTTYVGDDEQNLKKADKVEGRYVPATPPSTGDGKWEIDTNDAGRTAKNPDYPHQDKGEMIDRPQRAKQVVAHYTTNTAPRKKAKVVVEEVEFFTFFIKDNKICLMFKWSFKVKWVFKDGDDPTKPESMDRAKVTTEFSGPTQCTEGSADWKSGEANLSDAMGRFPK